MNIGSIIWKHFLECIAHVSQIKYRPWLTLLVEECFKINNFLIPSEESISIPLLHTPPTSSHITYQKLLL